MPPFEAITDVDSDLDFLLVTGSFSLVSFEAVSVRFLPFDVFVVSPFVATDFDVVVETGSVRLAIREDVLLVEFVADIMYSKKC